jgi:hypothetical protein
VIKVLNNVFKDQEFNSLRNYLKRSINDFKPFDVGYDHNLYFHQVPKPINSHLNSVIKDTVGDFSDILTFARLNTPDKNNEFRIHADSKIFQKQPNLAAVFYLDSSSVDAPSGTAFFEHPVYGKEHNSNYPQIFPNDDGQWSKYYQYDAVENSMLLYKSDLYHGRQPWAVQKERIVIVKFMIMKETP